MKLTIQSFASLNSIVLAGLLATAGGAMAQNAAAMPPAGAMAAGQHGERMQQRDPAKMQARMAKHQAALKAKLKLTAAQEGAWSSYTSAMQPPADMGKRPAPEQRAEFDKLSTPERIDKMRAMRTERMAQMNAAMDKREQATKAFYAALTPEQQKTFDAEHKMRGPHGLGGEHGGPGHFGGPGGMKG